MLYSLFSQLLSDGDLALSNIPNTSLLIFITLYLFYYFL